MDRREVDIEEAIAVFNKLAGPQPDPTKDLFRSLESTIRRVVIRVKIRRVQSRFHSRTSSGEP